MKENFKADTLHVLAHTFEHAFEHDAHISWG